MLPASAVHTSVLFLFLALGNLRTKEVTAGCWLERERYEYIYRERERELCAGSLGFVRVVMNDEQKIMQLLVPGYKSASASSPGPVLSLSLSVSLSHVGGRLQLTSQSLTPAAGQISISL